MSPLKTPVEMNDHMRGDPNAPCILVEYGDYQCPDCRRGHTLIRRIERHFGAGVAFVFRNFPLTRIHMNAQSAAEVAEFAGAGGKFWEMHELLFDNQGRLGSQLYAELATQLGLNSDELLQSLDAGSLKERVRTDFISGVRSGVNGTPTFFINGDRYNGPHDFEHLSAAVETAQKSHAEQEDGIQS